MFAAICLAFVAAAIGFVVFGSPGAVIGFVGALVWCGIDAINNPGRWA